MNTVELFGREWSFWRSQEDERGLHGRLFLTDLHSKRCVTVEYHLPSKSFGFGLALEGGCAERALSIHLCVPPVAVWLSADGPMLGRLVQHLISFTPDSAASKFSGRHLSLDVHDCGIWWRLLVDRDTWSRKRPKWRDGSWYPLGFYQRRGDVEVVETRDILVPMPERSYRATAKLERSRWGFTKLPTWFDRVMTHADIDMHKGQQIPFPGKGENSWDCGDDATFSMHCPARTIEDGIGVLVAGVLHDRRRRGGPAVWPTPETSAAE